MSTIGHALIDPAAGPTPYAPGVPARTTEEAILSRRSLRAFSDRPVPRALIEELLALASRAPSGTNVQPWKVRVIAGEVRERVVQAMLAQVAQSGEGEMKPPYDYYPTQWRDPYLARRRKVGWDLYALLGLTRDNKAGMQAQHARNFAFFDAPVGLIFTIDRVMDQGSWLDYGMFLQTLMIAARARGLDTCPQAAFTQFHRLISETLSIPAEQQVVCGMALGYADPSKPEHTLLTERAAVAEFANFLS